MATTNETGGQDDGRYLPLPAGPRLHGRPSRQVGREFAFEAIFLVLGLMCGLIVGYFGALAWGFTQVDPLLKENLDLRAKLDAVRREQMTRPYQAAAPAEGERIILTSPVPTGR